MITEIKKDITTVTEGIVAHGCNCIGGFGAGVALAIRKKWPKVYDTFKTAGTGIQLLGQTQIVELTDMLYVANCFTQHCVGNDGGVYADTDAITNSLNETFYFAETSGLDLYMPKIGAGLGGLSYEDDVYPIFVQLSEQYPSVNVFVCDI